MSARFLLTVGIGALVLAAVPVAGHAGKPAGRRANHARSSCVITVPRVSVQSVHVPRVSVSGVHVGRVSVSSVQVPRVSVPRVNFPRTHVPGVNVPRVSVGVTHIRSTLSVSTGRPGATPPPGSGTYFSTRTTADLPVDLTIASVSPARPLEFPRTPVELWTTPPPVEASEDDVDPEEPDEEE